MSDWNSKIIEEFRATGGKVGGPFEGAPLLLLHSTGAKSGQDRVAPVMYLADGDDLVVFASKAGGSSRISSACHLFRTDLVRNAL